jgi:hypothetical protein
VNRFFLSLSLFFYSLWKKKWFVHFSYVWAKKRERMCACVDNLFFSLGGM